MRESKVSRSFITTKVTVNGEERLYPNMGKREVENFFKVSGIEYSSIKEEVIRYSCTETEFLSIAKPC